MSRQHDSTGGGLRETARVKRMHANLMDVEADAEQDGWAELVGQLQVNMRNETYCLRLCQAKQRRLSDDAEGGIFKPLVPNR